MAISIVHLALIAFILKSAVAGDVEAPNETTNNTDSAAKTNTTGLIAPIESSTVVTAPPVVATDYVCKSCSCKDDFIDCSGKDLETFFTVGDWTGVTKMAPKVVDMSQNDFETITAFSDLPIEKLNLSSCGILKIDDLSFKNMQKMKVLDLSNNKLTSAALSPHVFEGRYSPEEYEPLASMRILNLAQNDLHSLHQDVFEHMPDLEELDLSYNPFTVIDHVTVVAISSLPYIKILSMRGCQIKELPEKFLHTPRYLERLDLSDNDLSVVPQELEEAKSLKYLNLNNNPIKYIVAGDEIYKPFPSIPSLKELHLCEMPKLQEIRNYAMGQLSGLEILHMSHNLELCAIEPMALARKDPEGEGWDYPMVQEIYLRGNNLTGIDSRILGRWDQVRTIDIRYNPFLCDCSNQWMVDTLIPMIIQTSPNLTMDIMCREPIEMRGKSMVHLEEVHREMRCIDKYGHRPERDGTLLIGAVIGILLAVPICLTVLLMYKKGYFGICGLKGPVEYSRAFYKRAHTDDLF